MFVSFNIIVRILQKIAPEKKKYLVSAILVFLGIIVTHGNMNLKEYRLYEMWFVYLGVIFMFNTFMCLNERYLIIPHVFNMLFLTVSMSLKADNNAEGGKPTVIFYVVIVFNLVFVPLG